MVAVAHWTNETAAAFDYNDYEIIHSSKNDEIHRQGVATVLPKKMSNLFVFQIYSPDLSYSDDEKEDFYLTLQQELNKLPRKNKLIVMVDFNGKIGKEGGTNWPNNVGKFSTGMMNENGEKLLQFRSINNLDIINIMYKHPPKCLYTG